MVHHQTVILLTVVHHQTVLLLTVVHHQTVDLSLTMEHDQTVDLLLITIMEVKQIEAGNEIQQILLLQSHNKNVIIITL